MSDLPATREYERVCARRVAEATPRTYGATRIEVAAAEMHDELLARVAELEAALAERDRQWAELRRKMQVTAKVGIDIYVRGNAEDFIKMMDRARAATPGAEHGYLWNVCYLCHQPIQPDQESEEWEPGYRHFECPARAKEGSGT